MGNEVFFRFKIAVLLSVFLWLTGCKTNNWDIDTTTIQVEPEFKRFDQDLFSISGDSAWNQIYELEKKYHPFLNIYNTQVIRIGNINMFDYDEKLNYFITDPDITRVYVEVQQLFNPLPFRETLSMAFKRYYHYFPNKVTPAIYTHISGFNQSIIIDSSYLSISLDKYLGVDSKYYQMLQTPLYQRLNMHVLKIPSDVMYAWAETEFPYQDNKETLLGKMIYYGKLHLFLDAVLPNEADTLKWGFSNDQLKWCKRHEKQMWVYMVENKLLFTSKYKDINKYINDAPFTPTFSQDSPGRTGHWLGYQIVRNYMRHNPDVTLPELMDNDDYQRILTLSKYKP